MIITVMICMTMSTNTHALDTGESSVQGTATTPSFLLLIDRCSRHLTIEHIEEESLRYSQSSEASNRVGSWPGVHGR